VILGLKREKGQAMATADSFAALRNDKQKDKQRQGQRQLQRQLQRQPTLCDEAAKDGPPGLLG
jgi:hypothetical protein